MNPIPPARCMICCIHNIASCHPMFSAHCPDWQPLFSQPCLIWEMLQFPDHLGGPLLASPVCPCCAGEPELDTALQVRPHQGHFPPVGSAPSAAAQAAFCHQHPCWGMLLAWLTLCPWEAPGLFLQPILSINIYLIYLYLYLL